MQTGQESPGEEPEGGGDASFSKCHGARRTCLSLLGGGGLSLIFLLSLLSVATPTQWPHQMRPRAGAVALPDLLVSSRALRRGWSELDICAHSRLAISPGQGPQWRPTYHVAMILKLTNQANRLK